MPRCSCDPRSRMTASAAEAPLLGQHIPVAAFSRGAGVLGIAPPAPKSNASMRPQPTQSSKTMRTPQPPRIAAQSDIRKITPIDRRHRPASSHSFLAEGPRASRALSASRASSSPNSTAVARLGPHPVADGHLVDVAALAAPPCELAAYGLHAGGLQALVHAWVPHRRYVGMRSSQVVEAAQQRAVLAVRAAVVDAHEAHAHLLAPDMAARSTLPHHGACVGVEVLGAQAAVQFGVELPGDVRPL